MSEIDSYMTFRSPLAKPTQGSSKIGRRTETMALKGKPRDMNKWREVLLDPNVHFPGESSKYRRARNELLEAEAELRRLNEQVAAQRRTLPAGGLISLGAQEALKKQGVEARVISMPSWKLFEDQDEAYRESVLPSHIKARVSVEQAARFGWERYVGIDGARVGMRTFGESAPLQKLVKKFGFTVDAVVSAAIEQSNSAKG